MAVGKLVLHHLHVANLLHEVVCIDQTDDAFFVVGSHARGILFAVEHLLDAQRVRQSGNLNQNQLGPTIAHKLQRLRQGFFLADALEGAVVQTLNRDIVAFFDIGGRLGEDDANLFFRIFFQDAQQCGCFARTDKAGQCIQRDGSMGHRNTSSSLKLPWKMQGKIRSQVSGRKKIL